MPKKWVHIDYRPKDQWLSPAWNSIHKAVRENRMKAIEQNILEISLHITTRLNMLPWIIKNINIKCKNLFNIVKKRVPQKYDFPSADKRYAFTIEDDYLIFNILIFIDSLLFEINSTCELISSYLYEIYAFTGKNIAKKDIGKEFKKIIKEAGEDIEWFENLDSHINFFIHEGAPWVAVDISNEDYYDLIIMKENLKAFDDEEKYITLSELSEIVDGFQRAKAILQKHLVDYIDKL